MTPDPTDGDAGPAPEPAEGAAPGADAAAIEPGFEDLGLPPALLAALERVGYETPSPIQAQTIPHLLAGHDLLGHAPTGTGKTAAFTLPLLARLDLGRRAPQALVLTPTRELAIQVAEACRRYAAELPDFHVLPIYGGQEYRTQLRQLQRGVHVVVGTPGRIMDHMRRGTLDLDALRVLVLDEADEMLRMGFIDDVEWILAQTPPARQTALFSATLPRAIQRIAQSYLKAPVEVSIAARTATAETIRQRWWLVSGLHKLDALTRILEVEPFDALLIFVRTKTATVELAERLEARGYAAAALNGDLPQKLREQIVERLRQGQLDVIVATDVAARGLDVERISHVVNYDIPYDTEAYIHRIGRTGRAGRSGEAILFVSPRERRMLRAIEQATRQPIEPLQLPSTETVNDKRIADFKQRITDALAAGELDFLQSLVEQYQQEHDVPAVEIAAALARLVIGEQPLLLPPEPERPPRRESRERRDRDWQKGRAPERPRAGARQPERGERAFADRRGGERRASGEDAGAPRRGYRDGERERPAGGDRDDRRERRGGPPAEGMERFRIEVGRNDGVKPGNIVGAIANEAGLEGRYIGRIDIRDDHSTLDLPSGMPKELLQHLKKTRVCGRPLGIKRIGAQGDKTRRDRDR
ncbi:ATP-dependent RNA helicase [Thiohalocapsa halophila]|uniref:ATP-dependent RNA helicase DeaD n=2 Tax=Thiohalocapsa halophila TaxID=69359 RepID=A0ABS1CNW9_9GAMM|nr:ATP-dependent RNA helicase [Thiohalocapsa halophila]